MTAQIILIEAQPRVPADGSTVTLRFAGGGSGRPFYYDSEHWRAGIASFPTVIASIDFKGDDLGTGGIPQAMEIKWAPPRQADLAEAAAYHWIDAAFAVRIGPEDDLPDITVAGKVVDAPIEDGAVRFQMSDPAADLTKPLLTDRFAGSGGIEGPIDWDGQIKKRAWGRCFNVKGDPIDPANNIYCFGDPSRPWEAIDAVRDKGADADPAALTSQAWAGSAAATFAALQGAAAPQGGGVVAPSIACVKWWTEPAGALTADIRGEIGAGYVETAPEIVERIVAAMSAVAFSEGSVAAFAMARPAAIGRLVDSESTTAAQLLDELLGDVSLLWVLNSDGNIEIRPWEWGASVASAVSHGVKRKQTFRPVKSRRLGYQRNNSPAARGELAAILLTLNSIIRSDAPAPEEALPGATWYDQDDDMRAYTRTAGSGELAFGGVVISFGGLTIAAAWTPSADQTLLDTIQGAQAALADLANFADDAVLDTSEKKKLVADAAAIEVGWAELDARAATLGIAAERMAAADARTDWLTLLASISPAYTLADVPSPIDRGNYNDARTAYEAALATLSSAISTRDSQRALKIAGPASSSVTANADGSFDPGVLPKVINLQLLDGGGGNASDSADWSVSVVSGSATADIDEAGGTAALAVSDLGSTSAFEVAAAIDGVEVDRFTHTMRKDIAAGSTGGGGGGGGGGTTGTGAISGTLNPSGSYGAISPVITAQAGSAGQVACSANIDFTCVDDVEDFGITAHAKWMWRTVGGSFADITTAIAAQSPASVTDTGLILHGNHVYSRDPGSNVCNMTKTSLSAGTDYEFQLFALIDNAGRHLSFSGSGGAAAQCVGS